MMSSNFVISLLERAMQFWQDKQLERAYRQASLEAAWDQDDAIADGLSDEIW